MAGFEVTLYGRIWVTPEEIVEQYLFTVLDLRVSLAARAGVAATNLVTFCVGAY